MTNESLTPREQSGELKITENKEFAIPLLMTVSAETGTTQESITSNTQICEVKVESNDFTIPIPSLVSTDLQQLDETVKSMMETSQNMFPMGRKQTRGKICKVCEKEGHPTDIMRHIEANHVEGIEIPCNQCGKICRSRDGLRNHISRYHRHQ